MIDVTTRRAAFAELHDAGCFVAARCRDGRGGFVDRRRDADPTAPLFDYLPAVERVRAAREAIDAAGVRVPLTARCEAHLVGHATPLDGYAG